MQVIEKIEQWAHDRNLILGSTPQAQLNKLLEEIGELAKGINKKYQKKIARLLKILEAWERWQNRA